MNDFETLFSWLKVVTWLAAIGTTLFPILYLFSPWYTSVTGRVLMFQSVAFAAAVDLTLMGYYDIPESLTFSLWLGIIVLGWIAVATFAFSFLLWRTNHFYPIRSSRRSAEQDNREETP